MANEKRLIDAYTLAEEIESLTITVAGKPAKWNDAKHSVLRILAEQPDVDAVEVVRCRDCKHGVWDEYEQMWKCVYSAEFDDDVSEWLGFFEFNDGEHFCSRGERKDDG